MGWVYEKCGSDVFCSKIDLSVASKQKFLIDTTFNTSFDLLDHLGTTAKKMIWHFFDISVNGVHTNEFLEFYYKERQRRIVKLTTYMFKYVLNVKLAL